MVRQRHPPGPPMTPGNMRVHHLIAFCLNDAHRDPAHRKGPLVADGPY
jgi:hypothetical protein